MLPKLRLYIPTLATSSQTSPEACFHGDSNSASGVGRDTKSEITRVDLRDGDWSSTARGMRALPAVKAEEQLGKAEEQPRKAQELLGKAEEQPRKAEELPGKAKEQLTHLSFQP